jgi:CheY-like chemotaxis protein
MTADQMKKAFEEFHHDEAQDGSYRGRLTGVGLGLPLSKRFVELHGGEMGVEAVAGVGTTFWFSLPSAPVDGTVQEDAWRPIRAVGLPGAGERVLVLSGCDGRLAHFLQRHLRGCQVVATPTLARAATIATEFRALAILADIDEGLTVDPSRLPVPLIRLPLPHNDRISSALGTVACLVKPVTRSELRAAIARLARPVRTILIADDDPRFVRLMTRFLQGYEIQGAPDGRAALALMADSPPDLLLLDLMMPEMDGTEVLAAMAARPELARIPVIVVSARDRAGGQLSLPGALSVEKPDGFRLEELLGVVEALLGQLDPPRQYLTRHPDGPRRRRPPQPKAPSAAMS